MNPFKTKQNKTSVTGKTAGLMWFVFLITPLIIVASQVRAHVFIFHLLLLTTGWLSWTYTEYYFHRFVMHEADSSKGLGKLLNHTHHHTDPSDIRVTTPHRILMTTVSVALVVFSVLLNNYFTIFCGYFFGFTAFCLMHIVLHHSWSKKVFPQLHQFHINHHCKHIDKCFGVTVPWWDHLFGSVPDKNTTISKKVLGFYYKKGRKIISMSENTSIEKLSA